MNTGDIVFFKRAKHSAQRKAAEIGFKGHGFGIFLGHVPPFAKDPPAIFIMQKLGAMGFVTFDDIGEFLGKAAMLDCVKKAEEKYYGKRILLPVPPKEPILLPIEGENGFHE